MKIKNAVLIVCLIIVNITISSLAYNIAGLENFEKSTMYRDGYFADVDSTAWYLDNVSSVYQYGLMSGVGNGLFNPNGNITLAETITVSTRIHSTYHYGESVYIDPNEQYSFWYEPYVEYGITFDIISDNYSSYEISSTRAEFAKILAASIDPVDFEEINLVDDGAIPDVSIDADYAEAVYLLYRAGVLTGSDANGTFNPDSTITRAEAAAIVTRIVDPSLRKAIELIGEY